jgi:hypothetical protein
VAASASEATAPRWRVTLILPPKNECCGPFPARIPRLEG